MMTRIFVVGSGASGVHFALSALKKGHHVTMLDVGFTGPEPVNPGDHFSQLKCTLKDPAAYFLGEKFESVVPPDFEKEIYGFPPNKQYIFKHPAGFKEISTGFEPLFSFAAGGLAQAWTGGAYPFDDHDLAEFPFGYEELRPFYDEVAQRIGIMGDEDALSRFFPVHRHLLPPLKFDEQSQVLADTYREKGEHLTGKTGVYFGRSRVAVLSQDKQNRKACDYSGRCIWGCPSDSLYVPMITLKECLGYENFAYIPRHMVTHFRYEANRVTAVIARNLENNEPTAFSVDFLVMAAGTLSSTMVYLESIYRQTGEVLKLHGLMDNRQILVPFINLQMLGKPYNPQSYQYHQLALGFRDDSLKGNDYGDYIHGQVTTLKTALMQPVLQTMPLDWQTATLLGRNLHSALGVININFSDTRRDSNYITLHPFPHGISTLELRYVEPANEKKRIFSAIKKIKKFMSGLGNIIPPGQIHIRPMGASVHYSGTIPMAKNPQSHTLSPNCRSYDFENLYFVDGTSLPFLPAKNLTFTLMANAVRVAEKEF